MDEPEQDSDAPKYVHLEYAETEWSCCYSWRGKVGSDRAASVPPSSKPPSVAADLQSRAGSECADGDAGVGGDSRNPARAELFPARPCFSSRPLHVPINDAVSGRKAKINLVKAEKLEEVVEENVTDSCEAVQELANMFQLHVDQLDQVVEEQVDLHEPKVVDVFHVGHVDHECLDPEVPQKM